MYTYKDPTGQQQGPFSRADILDWYQQGYFPDDLQLRAASGASETEPFIPLLTMIAHWKALGSSAPDEAAVSQQQQQQQAPVAQQQVWHHRPVAELLGMQSACSTNFTVCGRFVLFA